MFNWDRGPEGEILAPPLMLGATIENAVTSLVSASGGDDVPQRGMQLEGVVNLALMRLHQENLLRAIGGESNHPLAQALFIAVVGHGQPLSLRPLSMESLVFKKFSPIFRRGNSPYSWKVGTPPHQVELEGEPKESLRQAMHIYRKWADQEATQLQQFLQKKVKNVRPEAVHLLWEAELSYERKTTPAPGYSVQKMGGHRQYYMSSPSGSVLLEASSPMQMARYLSLIVRSEIPVPSPENVLDAVCDLTGAEPQARKGAWQMGPVQGKRITGQSFALCLGDEQFFLRPTGKRTVELERKATGYRWELVMPDSWSALEKGVVGLAWASRVITTIRKTSPS